MMDPLFGWKCVVILEHAEDLRPWKFNAGETGVFPVAVLRTGGQHPHTHLPPNSAPSRSELT